MESMAHYYFFCFVYCPHFWLVLQEVHWQCSTLNLFICDMHFLQQSVGNEKDETWIRMIERWHLARSPCIADVCARLCVKIQARARALCCFINSSKPVNRIVFKFDFFFFLPAFVSLSLSRSLLSPCDQTAAGIWWCVRAAESAAVYKNKIKQGDE